MLTFAADLVPLISKHAPSERGNFKEREGAMLAATGGSAAGLGPVTQTACTVTVHRSVGTRN